MTGDKYNGWTNYETWCVHLWMTNDRGSYDGWTSLARDALSYAEANSVLTVEQAAARDLADGLKEQMESDNPLEDQCSLWADLLGAALSEVNWDEIATAFIDEVKGGVE